MQITQSESDSLLRSLAQSKADTNKVKILLNLGEYQLYKPGEYKEDLDSALNYAKQAFALSQKLDNHQLETQSLNLFGSIYLELKNFNLAIEYQQKAIDLSYKHGDTQAEANSSMLLANVFRQKGDLEDARKQGQKSIELSVNNGHFQQAADAYLEMGKSYANYGEELGEKIKYFQLAKEAFGQAGNTKGQADLGKDLGDLYYLQGSSAQALLELKKALSLYQSINHQPLQGVYDLLGTVSCDLSDFQEALKYGLLAVETAELVNDTSLQLCTIYNRVGLTYFYLNQFQKAHIYFEKSLRVAQNHDYQPSIMIVTYNIANILVKLGQPEVSAQLLLSTIKQYPPQNKNDSIETVSRLLRNYTQLKQFRLAEPYYKQLLSFSDGLGENESIRKIMYNSIMAFLMESKQYTLAQKYATEYEEFSSFTNYLLGKSEAKLYMFWLDSIQANYPSAIRHYQQYKLLQDSLMNQTKNRQVASLEVLYETEKKEQDLKLKEQNITALTQEKQLQQAQIKKERLIRNGIIGGAILLLLLLGVIYNRYRLKQQSNKMLQAQQITLKEQQQQIQEKNQALEQLLVEKERLLKEIHHRVKNNLQIVMSLLNSQVASLQDKVALSAIQDSQNRVHAMALIHQKLYQSEGVARIQMKTYIEELVAYLRDSYDLSQKVSFKLSIGHIELDVNMAVPLGLIINEAITNAFKYAFPADRSGEVHISLLQKADTSYELKIEDDGVGLPKGYDPSKSRSLGMTLIHGFSDQLGAALSIESELGVSLSIVFIEEKLDYSQSKAGYVN